MHLYGQTTNPLWSCFEKGQLGVFIYPYGSLYTREKLRGKRETLLYRKLMKRGPGQDRGVQKTSVPILLEPQLSLLTSA